MLTPRSSSNKPPEFEPFLIHPPSDRGGPGPRFAATVPAMHPAANTVEGGGSMSLDIECQIDFLCPQRLPMKSEEAGLGHMERLLLK